MIGLHIRFVSDNGSFKELATILLLPQPMSSMSMASLGSLIEKPV